jgi:hypothetical protein
VRNDVGGPVAVVKATKIGPQGGTKLRRLPLDVSQSVQHSNHVHQPQNVKLLNTNLHKNQAVLQDVSTFKLRNKNLLLEL